jgi:hypothetical protein
MQAAAVEPATMPRAHVHIRYVNNTTTNADLDEIAAWLSANDVIAA